MPENRRPRGNPVAQNPLLRKGGPHQKSRSAKRRGQRQALATELEEWREELEYDDNGSAPWGADPSSLPLEPLLH